MELQNQDGTSGPGWNFRTRIELQEQDGTSSILDLLENCLQTCVTYTIAECTVNKLLMMDKRTVRNM